MKTRKKRERKETLAEEIPPPKEKLTKKRAKKVATPTSKKSSSIPQFSETLPKLGKVAVTTKERKGKEARVELKFGPPEEPPVHTNQPTSLTTLENAKFKKLKSSDSTSMHSTSYPSP